MKSPNLSNHRRYWSETEDELLRDRINKNLSSHQYHAECAALASLFGRTELSVRSRAYQLDIGPILYRKKALLPSNPPPAVEQDKAYRPQPNFTTPREIRPLPQFSALDLLVLGFGLVVVAVTFTLQLVH